MRSVKTLLHICLIIVTLAAGTVLGLWQVKPPDAPLEGAYPHYLQTTLALADYAANYPEPPSQDAVYFPFLPGKMVQMAPMTSQILCVSACVLALFYGIVQTINRRLKRSFTIVLMGLLVLLSIGSAVVFPSGSYLFYIPLFAMTVVKLLAPWPPAHIAARVLGGASVLLLWVPVAFLLWVSMIQPMFL